MLAVAVLVRPRIFLHPQKHGTSGLENFVHFEEFGHSPDGRPLPRPKITTHNPQQGCPIAQQKEGWVVLVLMSMHSSLNDWGAGILIEALELCVGKVPQRHLEANSGAPGVVNQTKQNKAIADV